ncbi:MAG: hypothetical protein L6V83_01725 [Christensenella sp.]|nr:MAG: hypothetical protein L6V83_01725 [Christensenella sp.]
MVVLRDDERKNRFDRVLPENMYAFAELDCFVHKLAIIDLGLYRRVIGVEIEVSFKKLLIVTSHDVFVPVFTDVCHVIFCVHFVLFAVENVAENLSAIERLPDVESFRFLNRKLVECHIY